MRVVVTIIAVTPDDWTAQLQYISSSRPFPSEDSVNLRDTLLGVAIRCLHSGLHDQGPRSSLNSPATVCEICNIVPVNWSSVPHVIAQACSRLETICHGGLHEWLPTADKLRLFARGAGEDTVLIHTLLNYVE
jgi:hypothetical protein